MAETPTYNGWQTLTNTDSGCKTDIHKQTYSTEKDSHILHNCGNSSFFLTSSPPFNIQTVSSTFSSLAHRTLAFWNFCEWKLFPEFLWNSCRMRLENPSRQLWALLSHLSRHTHMRVHAHTHTHTRPFTQKGGLRGHWGPAEGQLTLLPMALTG